jgi:hypothetical protein
MQPRTGYCAFLLETESGSQLLAMMTRAFIVSAELQFAISLLSRPESKVIKLETQLS